MISNLFYTLFKYKEKAQKDELGYYPEKVDVKAFPERRFLWTSRFFVVISCLSLCFSMILGSALCILIPVKKTGMVPLQIDYQLYQVSLMSPSEARIYAGDLVTESLMAEYVTKRYTIGDSIEELKRRLGENDFIFLASDEMIYRVFAATEQPYFELLQQRGVRRKIEIGRIYPVSMDFWQVRFKTIDTAPDMPVDEFLKLMNVNTDTLVYLPKQGEPLISKWIATMRMKFSTAKYDDKDLGLINPFGITITSFDLSYFGNNLKSKRE